MNKIVIVFENMAKVKPTSTDVRSYCDLFLVQFSNIAMRGIEFFISLLFIFYINCNCL